MSTSLMSTKRSYDPARLEHDESFFGLSLCVHYLRRMQLVFVALILATTVSAQSSPCQGQETVTSRMFLQQVSTYSAILKWRGDSDKVCLGKQAGNLARSINADWIDGHYVAQLQDLEADTTYFYSIGGAATTSAKYQFRTAPKAGQLPADGNTHIWLLGDSGTATETQGGRYTHPGEALEVLNGFKKYNRTQANDEALDLILLLGDNAYLAGTDAQWQGAFFDIYTDLIRKAATWPTIGNHEMGVAPLDICLFMDLPACSKGPVESHFGGVSDSADAATYDGDGDGPDADGLPYLNIFSLPAHAEQGGVASGTEQYYAFNYANVHVVSLDSQLSNRDPIQRAAMRDWLVDDLSSNNQDWTVVIFHHPPYSKGQNHDSDVEQNEIDMRETFVRVFEDYSVDVVFSGHSHSYERSWYLHGHYGSAATFSVDQHAEMNRSGKASLGQETEAYRQISVGSSLDDKVVYTVAGNAGKADKEKPCKQGRTMGCSLPNWLSHPAHRTFSPGQPGYRSNGLALKGSVVLDATRETLTSRFIDDQGDVKDYFRITRTVAEAE